MRNDLILEDTTLRDGEQSPGVAFSKETKIKIHDALVAAGVRWIEAGIPVMGGEELDTLRTLLDRGSEATLVGWNRGVKEDVQQSLDLGFKAVHIGLPASKQHLKDSVGKKSRGWLLESATELIKYAKDRGAYVSVSAEDTGRTEISFLQEYAGRVHEAGADRLRLSDTIGILNPQQYGERIAAVASACAIDLMCHTHNDFGLAVANTIAGLEAGARYFHVTVNGIGERAGMSDIAQVVFALKYLYGRDLGIDGGELKKASNLVAEATGHPPPPWHPVVGENVFSHESGIHVRGMLKDTSTFEPFPAEAAGGERRYIIGKHSGRATLRFHLEQRGITTTEEILQTCLEHVRQRSIDVGGAVSPDELEAIYHRVTTA
jgi:homocitrate synthase NifV